jgi:hypothetical protein
MTVKDVLRVINKKSTVSLIKNTTCLYKGTSFKEMKREYGNLEVHEIFPTNAYSVILMINHPKKVGE